MKKLEYRYFNSTELETRSPTSDDFIGQIAGYAIKFNTPSTAKAPFIEYIAPSALENVDLTQVLGLYNHDFANILGRVEANTLKLTIDDVGLHFVLDMPDTTIGHDVYNNIKAGNLRGMSFGFIVAEGGDSWQQGSEKPIRIINQLDTLSEISVVSRPAYDDTSVQVTRSMDAFLLERTRNYKEKVKIYLGGLNEN